MQVAIIAITGNGARLGEVLQQGIPGSRLFVIEKHAGPACEAFSEPVPALISRLWPEFGGFICIMATGIVVRCIAPLLQAKDRDPAVVVLDDAGKFAVSLLSGHLGGANSLAKSCASLIGCTPVITTATDANDLPSFDLLAKENGWVIDDLSLVKVLNALLLEGKEIAVADPTGRVKSYCAGRGNLTFVADAEEAAASGAAGMLLVTNRTLDPILDPQRTLVLRPVDLHLGVGCNRGTAAEEIEAVVTRNLEGLGLSLKSVNCLASARAKEDEAGLLAFAAKLGVPLLFFDNDELNAVSVPSPPSEHAMAAIGARGVAEPAALLASGGGTLIMKKVKDGNVTLAVAQEKTKDSHTDDADEADNRGLI